MNEDAIVIDIRNLVKRYRHADRKALDGIILTVKKGRFFGLLGPNGGGKTTLISILCGLLKPTKGTAFILGHNVSKDFKPIRSLIGLIPQEIALYPTLTLIQNLQLFANLYGIHGKQLKERIDYCLELSQLSGFATKPVGSYSGGMKRRANLVTGLIHDPQIVFLDEPTANVDPQSRHVIYDGLTHLIENKVTIVYTTHYLEEAESLCSDLAIIDSGQIIAAGTPSELLKNYHHCKDLGELFLHLTGKTLRDEY